jgi:hypothetical protein
MERRPSTLQCEQLLRSSSDAVGMGRARSVIAVPPLCPGLHAARCRRSTNTRRDGAPGREGGPQLIEPVEEVIRDASEVDLEATRMRRRRSLGVTREEARVHAHRPPRSSDRGIRGTTTASGPSRHRQRSDSAGQATGWPRNGSPTPAARWRPESLLPCRVGIQPSRTEFSDITPSVAPWEGRCACMIEHGVNHRPLLA